jgi:hypothetical protein
MEQEPRITAGDKNNNIYIIKLFSLEIAACRNTIHIYSLLYHIITCDLIKLPRHQSLHIVRCDEL